MRCHTVSKLSMVSGVRNVACSTVAASRLWRNGSSDNLDLCTASNGTARSRAPLRSALAAVLLHPSPAPHTCMCSTSSAATPRVASPTALTPSSLQQARARIGPGAQRPDRANLLLQSAHLPLRKCPRPRDFGMHRNAMRSQCIRTCVHLITLHWVTTRLCTLQSLRWHKVRLGPHDVNNFVYL